MEQELAAGLGEWQISEFIEDDEVHAGQLIGEPALPSVTGLGLEPVDEIDNVVKPAAGAGSDDRFEATAMAQMGFTGAGRSSVTMPGVRRIR